MMEPTILDGKCPRCGGAIEAQSVKPDNSYEGRCLRCGAEVAGTIFLPEEHSGVTFAGDDEYVFFGGILCPSGRHRPRQIPRTKAALRTLLESDTLRLRCDACDVSFEPTESEKKGLWRMAAPPEAEGT